MEQRDSELELDSSEENDDHSVEFLHDDRVDPNEVTLFTPGDDSIATEWITADVSTAVALDDVR